MSAKRERQNDKIQVFIAGDRARFIERMKRPGIREVLARNFARLFDALPPNGEIPQQARERFSAVEHALEDVKEASGLDYPEFYRFLSDFGRTKLHMALTVADLPQPRFGEKHHE